MAETECHASDHEFKLHDWRWLAWPLSNTSAKGRWCRLCGLTQGKPDGQCAVTGCLEYADAVDREHCESCARKREIDDTRSRLAQKVLALVREHAPIFHDDESERQQVIDELEAALRELFQREGVEVGGKS